MGIREPALLCFVLFTLLSLCSVHTCAAKKLYIVYMGSHSHGREATVDVHARVEHSHHQFLGSFLGSYEKAKEATIYSYKRHINGFAAMLEEEEAAEIATHPGVVSVFMNQARELHTTHSWDFMLLENNGVIHPDSAWKKAKFGEDVIIGHLDTGIWPESKSFSDEGYGPVPSRWRGTCVNTTANGVSCNRKIIGARYFVKGFESTVGPVNSSMKTPRDYEGHGSHTMSTSGGNFVPGANVFGVGNGTAKGGSPRARLAAYKICWPGTSGSCHDADILEAFDVAIDDGVDVLSLSLGGLTSSYSIDSVAIGAFHAVKHGIVVVCSAGNMGPARGMAANLAPWILTVAASTQDRDIHNFVEVRNGTGMVRFKGGSLPGSDPLPEGTMYPMITGEQARRPNVSVLQAMMCSEETLDPEKVSGKILVCDFGGNSFVAMGRYAAEVGAVGIVVANGFSFRKEFFLEPFTLPAINIGYDDGVALIDYVNSTKDPVGYITAPVAELNVTPAPTVAAFSSRGPNFITPEILKPDITAPGVQIIAAFTEGVSPSGEDSDQRRSPYYVMSGTSMSCPHVAGVAGLVKAAHPNWSPAAIKSAIMTTARTRDNSFKSMQDSNTNMKATPFDYGSGHIRPNRAMDPGLVYDMSADDYLSFLCAAGYDDKTVQSFLEESHDNYRCPESNSLLKTNYPAIMVRDLCKPITVTRRLKNVGEPATYKASVRAPHGTTVSVEPSVLTFERVGEEKEFKLTLKVSGSHPKSLHREADYYFGGLTWSDGKHYVRSPIGITFAMKYY